MTNLKMNFKMSMSNKKDGLVIVKNQINSKMVPSNLNKNIKTTIRNKRHKYL